jgi:hypothetical protein
MPFHGTDVASTLGLLNGMDLDATVASARKMDGPPGFFLALELDDAAFFAARRQGTIVEVRLSPHAVQRLHAAGMIRRPIPSGRTSRFLGDEYLIPPDAFATFNQLRWAGDIEFLPARWP